MRVPPLIHSAEEVRQKLQLLEALGDIQAALEVMGGPALDGRHPADRHYEGLQCDLTALEPSADDYQVPGLTGAGGIFVSARCKA